jgi:hypothetical protein
MDMNIPGSLLEEHAHLQHALERATQEEGAVGVAARAVMEVLGPHFEKEEEFALPPLGMLTVSGEAPTGDVERTIGLTERLGRELPLMLEEHGLIALKLEVLTAEAERAEKNEYVVLARDLLHHARMEEEVMYPASLLIGSYLRLGRSRKERG